MPPRTGRTERFDRDLQAAFEALDNHDFDAAESALERCRRIDRNHPDVLAIDATLSAIDGDYERALELWEKLIEQRSDDPQPRIAAATLALDEMFDPDRALTLVGPAFEHIEEEGDLVAAVSVKTGAHLMLASIAKDEDDQARSDKQREFAREALSELATSVIEDPDQLVELTFLAIDAGDDKAAVAWIAKLEADDETRSDGLLARARMCERNGDEPGKLKAWQEVRVLDLQMEEPEVAIAVQEAERIVKEALGVLPARARAVADAATIQIHTVPSEQQVNDGIDPRCLVRFSGDGKLTIDVFKLNLERLSSDADHFFDELHVNTVQEAAEYFELEQDELEAPDLT
ncbi:MAG: hypothetical protein KBG15_02080 [Kofleriaceae bacterium]|nr:hypothetical protein [Kofleriaceae bacterium]